MSQHRAWIAGTDPWQGKCTCKATGPVTTLRWQADDWVRDHIDQVERARAHRRGTPSLASTRDYYRRMETTTTDPVHRDQWRMLADELDHRLGNFRHSDDAPLW